MSTLLDDVAQPLRRKLEVVHSGIKARPAVVAQLTALVLATAHLRQQDIGKLCFGSREAIDSHEGAR